MSPTDPRIQLDVPLVWAGEPAEPDEPSPRAPSPPSAARDRGNGALRVVAAALADLGIVVLLFAVTWIVASVGTAGLGPAALVLVALAGLEAATVGFTAWLWGFRGTPGMLLLDVCFVSPLPPGRALTVWLVWLVALPLAGIPLLVHRGGERLLDRLAGTALRARSSPSAA